MKILVIEDEEQIARFLKEILSNENFSVTLCDAIEDAIENKHHLSHDLIILDLMLKGARGEELVKLMREKGSKVPILVLSALNQINTKVDLINMGADDYMVKPFDAQELIARVNALHRRYLEVHDEDEENYGDISFFWKQNKIIREGKTINLTKKEANLLRFLFQRAGQSVSLEDILTKVWQSKIGYQSNVVQSTVRRLRKKVDSSFSHKLIRNIHGVGYTLVLPKK